MSSKAGFEFILILLVECQVSIQAVEVGFTSKFSLISADHIIKELKEENQLPILSK